MLVLLLRVNVSRALLNRFENGGEPHNGSRLRQARDLPDVLVVSLRVCCDRVACEPQMAVKRIESERHGSFRCDDQPTSHRRRRIAEKDAEIVDRKDRASKTGDAEECTNAARDGGHASVSEK